MTLQRKEFPILEFDENRKAYIEPGELIKKMDIPEFCVITFFRDVIEKKLAAGCLRQVSKFSCEMMEIPVYETEHQGKKVCLTQGFVGAAGAAAQLEELIAMGFKKFIVCGGAGVLQKDIAVGHLIIPSCAIRDEGTSYHYLQPSREVSCNAEALDVIELKLKSESIPYLLAKTWTNDAFYRETKDKVALRVLEGCVSVEMEAAALFAVAQFRGVILGQILYGGDDLSGESWDSRKWDGRKQIRENLVDLSMDICLDL